MIKSHDLRVGVPSDFLRSLFRNVTYEGLCLCDSRFNIQPTLEFVFFLEDSPHLTLITGEDPAFTAGSYVIIQKYLHDLAGWNKLSIEKQEKIVGRTKLNDVELDDRVKPTYAHNALTKIVRDGKEIKILRDNMAFGHAGLKEFGTYFIGYSRSPRTIEEMLQNMFVGKPPGNYDQLLDFSRAVTGNLFFIPSATFLENVKAN